MFGDTQLLALIVSHRIEWLTKRRRWAASVLWRCGAGSVGGRTLSVAWRSDSAQWEHDFRGRPLPLIPLEITTRANTPYVS